MILLENLLTRRGAPLSPHDKQRLHVPDQAIAQCWAQVLAAQGSIDEAQHLHQWRLAKRRRKDGFIQRSRSRYVKSVIAAMQQDLASRDWGKVYQRLRDMGISTEG